MIRFRMFLWSRQFPNKNDNYRDKYLFDIEGLDSVSKYGFRRWPVKDEILRGFDKYSQLRELSLMGSHENLDFDEICGWIPLDDLKHATYIHCYKLTIEEVDDMSRCELAMALSLQRYAK